jgi:5-formyltetrahydrofolate cyclo-ligase
MTLKGECLMTPFPLPSHYAAKPLLRAWVKAQSSPILTSPLLHSAVVAHLTAAAFWQPASSVMVYCPMAHEIDLSSLWQGSAGAGKVFLLPRRLYRQAPEGGRGLTLHHLRDVKTWTTTAYGLTEPGPEVPVASVSVPDVCLLPALAMDRHGYRLGSGQGYYDRWLASLPTRPPLCLGVVPQHRVVEPFDHDPWDIPLDGWITETGVVIL